MNVNSVKRIIIAVSAVFLLTIGLLTGAKQVEAMTIIIDPGEAGTSFSHNDFDFDSLNGTALNGQSQSFDIMFADNKFAVASSVNIDFYINQSGDIGTWPTNAYSVTGYLIDTAGNPMSSQASFPLNCEMPAQIWPGWDFFLPDGTQYLPLTTGYGGAFSGAPIYGDPNGYFIDPIIFSGIHFEIIYPESATEDTVIGSRLCLSNSNFPIYISPDTLPEFYVSVPEPSTLLLLGSALIGLAVFRKKFKK